jgi:diguanylate cyclase (GGDEF)-like protein
MPIGVAAFTGYQPADEQASDLARVSVRAGTRVAFGLPAIGLALLGLWLMGGHGSTPSAWALVVLPAICVGYGVFPVALGPRAYASFEGPTVVLAGLVGGPIAGVVAAIATGLGDVRAVWRRRCAYAGLTMIYGFTAGLAGDAWRSGATTLLPAVGAACLGYLVIYVAGFAVILLDRQSYRTDWVVHALALDTAEIACAFPLIALFASSFASQPALVAVSVVSILAIVTFAVSALMRERELVESERQARHRDPLTGALTRLAFDDSLAREQARVLRGDHTSGLIVCDLDHFAGFNQRYGHLGGDAALRFVVTQITRATRGSDLVARWGGEELCVIAPDIGSLKELGALCERIRAAVAETAFPVGDDEAAITISLGATLLTEWHTAEQTFARADEALYQAKRTRDAWCVLEPRPSDSHASAAPAPRRSAELTY